MQTPQGVDATHGGELFRVDEEYGAEGDLGLKQIIGS
jgi:hypothetical protein